MEDYTLVVMAAGLSTRFGGKKQITPVGPNGEFIMDYSIYDALRAGFNRVVFVINKDIEKYFNKTIVQRVKDKIEVAIVIQEMDDLPLEYTVPKGRVKPWGTGHAIYAARNYIKGPFAVINADDFYGREAYEILMDFLKNNESRNCYVSVCYKLVNTLSMNGKVTRGVVTADNGILVDIKESSVDVIKNDIIASPLDGSKPFKVDNETLTSVNLFGFTANFIRTLPLKFEKFLEKHSNSLTDEFLLPKVIDDESKDGEATVYVKTTLSKWYGMTYKDDEDYLKKAILNMCVQGEYPEDLWKKVKNDEI